MSRGGGKLIPFLLEALLRNLYINLKYESSSSDVFYLDFPRLTKNKMSDFERILIDWYKCTGKRYPGYSGAKAVFKAGLKKSIYLVRLQTDGNKLRFRLATLQEIEEKKQLLKLKTMKDEVWNENGGEFSPPPRTPSVASSGYVSGNEESNEPMVVEHENNFGDIENLKSETLTVRPIEDKIIYDEQLPPIILQDEVKLDSFPQDFEALQKLMEEELPNFNESLLMEFSSNNLCDDASASRNNWQDGASSSMSLNDPVQQPPQSDALLNQAVELESTPVKPPQPDTLLNQAVDLESTPVIKTFWCSKQKIKLDNVIISISEKQILCENQGIQEGAVYIPDHFWEPGENPENYNLEKHFEIHEKYFCVFHLKNLV